MVLLALHFSYMMRISGIGEARRVDPATGPDIGAGHALRGPAWPAVFGQAALDRLFKAAKHCFRNILPDKNPVFIPHSQKRNCTKAV